MNSPEEIIPIRSLEGRQESIEYNAITEREAIEIAKRGGKEVDALIQHFEEEVRNQGGDKQTFFQLSFKDPSRFAPVLMAFATIGGMISGLDQSTISGANLYMPEALGLSENQSSLVDAGMPLGAVAGAIILSPCNEAFGRRISIIIAIFFYTLGAALEGGAMNFGMMIAARLILGIGVGLEGGTTPVYISETVARNLRGNVVSIYQFNIALGEVLGYIIASIFIRTKGNWRIILASSELFSTIMFIGMLFMPESPRWLMHKGRDLDAYKVWKRIRGFQTPESKAEFFILKASVLEVQQRQSDRAAKGRFPWLDFITVPRARRAIVYANMMVFLGQFTGINAVMYYMSTLMKQAGFSRENATYMSLVGGGSLLLGTIPAVLFMERCGRRFWAMVMLPGFFIGLIFVGISYEIPVSSSSALGLYLTGLIIYCGFFGSYACLTWVLPAEVYPTYLRSYGMTTSDGLLFLCSFLVTYNFTRMQASMTKIGLALGFYGGIAVFGWVYQLLFMPETNNKTLEEIDLIFEKPTREIVAENLRNVRQTTRYLMHGRWEEVFTSREPRQNL